MKYILLLAFLCTFVAYAQESGARKKSSDGRYKNGIRITESGLKISEVS